MAREALEGNDLDSAERHALNALRLASEILGPDHAEIATPYSLLAVIYTDSGKYRQAEICAQAAMEIFINSNQGDTVRAASTQVALAMSLCIQRKMDGVEVLFESAIASLRRHVGERGHEILTALNNQAIAYSMSGRAAEAEAILLKLYHLLGDSSPTYGLSKCDVLINLALSVLTQGDAGRALGIAEIALSNALCFHAKDYTRIATAHGVLFNINMERKDSIAAEGHARKILDVVSKHNARNLDPEIIKTARNFIASLEYSYRESLA
ncbi:MAG: tetratricopeptide repeat protein [Sulfuricaulis sp.]